MTTLFDILQQVKPRRALFTSYTYSSVWFEALPYPLLRKNDCEQITVMLDAREARNSIDNATSQYGGSRYRIVSTVPTGKGLGIFHPKIAYLEAEQGDVFVVGSGNLSVHGPGTLVRGHRCGERPRRTAGVRPGRGIFRAAARQARHAAASRARRVGPLRQARAGADGALRRQRHGIAIDMAGHDPGRQRRGRNSLPWRANICRRPRP
jgi:hypothetical protein